MSSSKPVILTLFITLFLVSTSFFMYYRNDIEILKSPEMWSEILQNIKYQKNEIDQTILKRKSYSLLSNLSLIISADGNGDIIAQNESESISISSIENGLLHAIDPGEEKGMYIGRSDNIIHLIYFNLKELFWQ